MKNTNLHYEVHGVKGPYLLMVHGLMSSRVQWMPNLDFLKSFCRPVIVELFGHGRSPSPSDPEQYAPDHYVAEFEAIRDALNARQWFVCGQSLGASLTLRYGLMHPERIPAQIFTNSRSAFSETSSEGRTSALVKVLEKEGWPALERLPVHPAKSRYLSPSIKKALIEDINLIDLQGFANTLKFLSPKSSVKAMIHENTVPTLMVTGKFDKAFIPLGEFAKQNMPHLEAVVLDGGHAVNIDAAFEFNEAVKAFIEKPLRVTCDA
ncbi:MAG: alpha/beta hydrolase [Proteobacteria bacterium]|nr:alpha/beta hydrolase [Pseudomonadota bacterium]MBU4471053.1 alpha/beta hydrolase [Pseudomonadota bacterium]MCG2753653.1 alpha/beta hydrolase [Desulfobacteraceae bacterium]